MTENPANRLWPLALMGWLAAFPPSSASATTGMLSPAPQLEAGVPGSRTAWLRDARALYAPLSSLERAALRRRRRRDWA
jgi:hypothetical protein